MLCKQQVWIMTVENNSGTCKQPEKQDGCRHLSVQLSGLISLAKGGHGSNTYLVDEYKGNIFLDQNETCLNVKAFRIM